MNVDGQQAEETSQGSRSEESIADRVAAQFGLTDGPEEVEQQAPQPEETEQVADGEAPAAEEFAEVEVDGQRYQVPKPLEKAFLAQKDYTQKTQTVAQREREFNVLQERVRLDGIQQAFEREMAPDLQKLNAYREVLKQPVDWASMPMEEMVRHRAQRDTWKEEAETLERSLSQRYQQFGDKQQQSLNELKTKALDTVSKQLQGWGENSVKDLKDYGKSEGYSDVELAHIEADPRHIRTLHKAREYDKLMASKAKAVQTATKAPPMVKPGTTRPMPQGVKNDLALKKAQSAAKTSSEKAKIIAQRLEGRF